jgi:hypothetical protein
VDKLLLEKLTVGQHGLRYNAEGMHRMMDFVADGGRWTEPALDEYADTYNLPKPSLIQLSEFNAEAGMAAVLLVHDGHHRLVATHLAGRAFLYPEEYRVTRWAFQAYQSINFSCGWVTPFDPRTHVRIADFAAWKQQILEMALEDPARAERMIREQPGAYCEPRRYSDIAALACDCCSLEVDQWRAKRLIPLVPDDVPLGKFG